MALPKGAVRTTIEVKGSREYERRMKSAARTLDEFGKGAGGLKSALGGIGPGAAVAAAAIGTAVIAVRELIQVGEQLGRVYVELGRRGGAFSAVANQFESMADPSLLGRLQELSGWHLDQQTLMASYNRVVSVGAVTADQFEEVVERVTSRAQAMGVDVETAFNQFSNAMAGRDMQAAFSSMGLSLDGVRDAVTAAGASMESERGAAIAFEMALEQLREEQGKVDNSAQNLGDAFDALETSTDDFIDTAARWISTSPAAIQAFDQLRTEIFGTDGAAKEAGQAVAEMAQVVISSAASMVNGVARAIGFFAEHYTEMLRNITQNSTIMSMLDAVGQGANVRAWLEWSEAWERGARAIADSSQRIHDIVSASAVISSGGADDTNRRRRPPRPPGGGAGDKGEEGGLATITAIEEMQAATDALIDSSFQWADLQDEQNQRFAEQQVTQFEERMAQYDALKEAEHELAELAIEEQAEAAEAIQEKMQERFDAIVGGIEATASGLSGVFSNITSIMEATGASAETVAKVEGAFLISYNAVMAATEVAKAIGAYPDVVGMIQHGLAAAAHVTAAALAAAELGGGTSNASTAASAVGSSFTPANTEQLPPPSEESGTMVTNNNYMLGRTNSEIGEALGESQWAFYSGGGTSFTDIAPRIR